MSSVNYKISNFDGIAFRSGVYVGATTQEVQIINSAGNFVGGISATSLSTTGTLSVTGISTFGAALKAANGTVSAPAYSNSAGTYGMYFTATAVNWSTNQIQAGSISSTQRWIIGSTATQGQVHTISAVDTLGANSGHLILSSGAAANIPFFIAKDRTDGSIGISGSSTAGTGAELRLFGSAYGSGFNNYFRFMQAGSDVMTISGTSVFSIAASGGQLGFFGVTPISRPSAYTFSNASALRTYDVSTVTLTQVANVLATLIGTDLKGYGLTQ